MVDNFEIQFQSNSVKIKFSDFISDSLLYINQSLNGEDLLIFKNDEPYVWIFSLKNNDLYEKNEFKDEYQNISLSDFITSPIKFLEISEKESDIFVFNNKEPVLEIRSYYERDFN